MLINNFRKFVIGKIKSIFPPVGVENQSTRERWLEQTLLKIPGNSRILDAGAGTQRYRGLCTHLKYVSQDFAQYDGRGDGRGQQTGKFDYGRLDIISDITTIPEPDAAFDAIMCIEVIEHLPEPIAAIREFARLTKPGGHLILTAPFASLTHYAPYHFSTGFNRYWYETILRENGFEILELTPNGNYFEYLAQEVRRIPSMASRYVENSGPKVLELLGEAYVLRMLSRFSRLDNGSSEVLCFGYHVFAQRRSDDDLHMKTLPQERSRTIL